MFKVNNKEIKTKSMTSFWFLTASVSIVNFEHVIAAWSGMPNHFEGFLFHVNFKFKIFCLRKSNLNLRDHSFETYAKFSEKLTFFIPGRFTSYLFGNVCVGIK